MPTITVHLTTPVPTSFRAEQIAGLFDVPLDERLSHVLTAEVPDPDEDWSIGAIVGPSGSGKTTLARAAFGDAVYAPQPWPPDQPIVEAIGGTAECHGGHSLQRGAGRRDVPIKEVIRILTGVGLSSPPAWLKPYGVLSTGERFRADLARALLTSGQNLAQRRKGAEFDALLDLRASATLRESLLVIDEFTSTLDRTVACTASAALSKLLRSNLKSEIGALATMGHLKSFPRLVAVTCHTDILPWLSPDWTLDLAGDPATGGSNLTRGRLPQPELRLDIRRVPRSLWPRFARHHYLSGGLSTAATCYAAFVERSDVREQRSEKDEPRLTSDLCSLTSSPIAFCAIVASLGWKQRKRITRLVVLPEYQGLGIGPRLAEAVAAIEQEKGNRISITASHPAILGHMSRSPRWRYSGLKKTGSTRQQLAGRTIRCSIGRAVASFEFVG